MIKNKKGQPRYQQIALEVATRIVSGEYKVGDKIFARSSLASQHGVSSETARRAICVLSDLGIVISERGSGVTILSSEKAKHLLNQQEQRISIDIIQDNIKKSLKAQQEEFIKLSEYISELTISTEHFRSLNPFVPFQIHITKDCKYLDKTIADIKFWENTSATVIAIRRNDTTILSPGPHAQFNENDIFFYICDSINSNIVTNFLYPTK